MGRRGKIAVLVAIGVGYAGAASLYVFVVLALHAWGGAWCDNCTPEQVRAIDQPGLDALNGAILIGAALAVALLIIGRQWLKRP